MNRCWQVLRTYAGRWRFWIVGAVYAWMSLVAVPFYWPTHARDSLTGGALLSLLFASILGCLVALHLRRLLSGPTSHAAPGFFGPHVVVGAAALLVLCVAVPWAQADLSGDSRLRTIGLGSLAGTLSALVLLWPRAVFLLTLGPLAVLWMESGRPGSALLMRFISGEEPAISTWAIVVAVVAYPSTATLLMRWRDRAATFSDDLVVDRAHEAGTRWKQPLLQLRDGAIDWRLGTAGRFAWPLRRWRTPCTASLSEIGLLLALVVVVMALTGLASDATGSLIVAAFASVIVLFIPLGAWRFRCRALSGEFLRPVARRQFARQFVAAMLADFSIWIAVAAVIAALGNLPLIWSGERGAPETLAIHTLGLLSIAVLVYGTALVTLQLRYWLPWFVGMLLAEVFGGYLALGYLVYFWGQLLKLPAHAALGFGSFVLTFGGIAALLGVVAYRRWLTMEVA